MTKKGRETVLEQDIYSENPISRLHVLTLGIAGVVIGFLFNFPIKQAAVAISGKMLNPLRHCPIEYKRTSIGFFMPKINFISPKIDGACFGQGVSSLALDRITMGIRGISFVPLGLLFHGQVKSGKTTINIYPTISFFTHHIKIDQTIIDTSIADNFLDREFIRGIFDLNGRMKWSQLEELDFNIESKNLSIPAQDIKGLQIPLLSIGTLSFKGAFQAEKNIFEIQNLAVFPNIESKNLSIPAQDIKGLQIPLLSIGTLSFKGAFQAEKNIFEIQNLAVGALSSQCITIRSKIDGDIKINEININLSSLNLKGEVKFSQSFIESFPILKLVIKNKDKLEGFHKFKIGGTMALPIPFFL